MIVQNPGKSLSFSGIQALRGIAATMVVIHHTTRAFHPSNGWANGASGVDIFFVISGFVMAVSTKEGCGAWEFLQKRLIRIVPLYWIMTAITLVGLVHKHASPSTWRTVSSLLFLPSMDAGGAIHPVLGVGWTLNFEMFFYILFALALTLGLRPLKLLAPVLIPLAVIGLWRQPDWHAWTMYASPLQLEFIAGLIIGNAARAGAFLSLPASLALGSIGFASILFEPLAANAGPLAVLQTGTCAVMIVIACVSLESRMVGHIPRPILYLGEASYAVYLAHILVLYHVVGKFGPVVAAAVSLVAGVLLHTLVEKPVTTFLRGTLADRARKSQGSLAGALQG